MNRKTKITLEQNGRKINDYLSLRIDKGDLPAGSEVVVMVRNKHTNELHPLSVEETVDFRDYAQNSRFYQQTMVDGHIFNPRIHRRFIAAQYRQLFHQYGVEGVPAGVAKSRSWDYAIGMLRKEVHALASLHAKDRQGYEERCRFFQLARCADIIDDYAEAVKRYADGQMKTGTEDYVYVGCIVNRKNVRPFKHRFDTFVAQVRCCTSYAHLDALLDEFEWCNLPDWLELPESFVKPFLEAGAYYAMKHHIMFEGLRLYEKTQDESLTYLRAMNGSYQVLYGYAMR